MVCFREGRSGSVFLAFDLRELVSGWRGSWVSDALLQKRFQLFDDFWALVIEISGLGKIVLIDEVLPGVIWGVDIYALNLLEIASL